MSTECCDGENFWFDKSVTNYMQSLVDGGVTVHLMSAGYAPRKLVDETMANVPAAAVIASQPITGLMASGRRLFGNDVEFPDLASQYGEITAIMLASNDGNLLSYIGSAHGLGVQPDGTTIVIKWDQGGIAGL